MAPRCVGIPACPPASIAGETCLYDFGPWNLLIPKAERTGLMLLGHQDFGSGLQVFTEIGAQHNTSFAQGAPTPLDETALMTVPVNHPNNPFPGATSIDISRYRTVDAGPRQWDIETDNLRGVLGVRGSIAEMEMGSRRSAGAQRIGSVGRSLAGLGANGFSAERRSTRSATTRSAACRTRSRRSKPSRRTW